MTPSPTGDPVSIPRDDEVGSGGVIRDALSRSGPTALGGQHGRVASNVIAFRSTPVLYGSGLSRGARGGFDAGGRHATEGAGRPLDIAGQSDKLMDLFCRPVAFQRMDNAIWASAYASQGKAVASAAFGRPSGEMAERADQPTPRGIAAAEGGHMIMGQGAVPIIRNGVVEGACGVSGGTGQQDEDCAGAGVSQL